MHKTKFFSGLITSLAIIGLFSACSSAPPSHMMNIKQGQTFELKVPIDIPAGSAKTYIQFGKVTGRSFNQTEQHCRIEINELQNQTTTIQPEQFKISNVEIGEEQIAAKTLPAGGIQLAFVGNAMAFGDNQRPETMDYVHFYLDSTQQPNVLRLTCSGALSNGNPFDEPRSHRPQREQINQILGTIGQM
ncbi:hypothetical protein [Thiomicrorhabdus indica]|uniref:hypothetical protein n=1 Tax=Thiomicrorhabdus indica TaxID=2267253 RepID=UPI00102DCC35|nr:hypothetical protein [Thiomicrorhabdus indica]